MPNFDPYYTWLGIPPDEQPPHHYRLLGLRCFEDNPTVIENAFDQRMVYLRTFQTGRHSQQSQTLLNQIAAARMCLLQPDKKAAYDRQLRQQLQPTAAAAASQLDPQLASVLERDAHAERIHPLHPPKKKSGAIVAIGAAAAAIIVIVVAVWALSPRQAPREIAKNAGAVAVADSGREPPPGAPANEEPPPAKTETPAVAPSAPKVEPSAPEPAVGGPGKPPASENPPGPASTPPSTEMAVAARSKPAANQVAGLPLAQPPMSADEGTKLAPLMTTQRPAEPGKMTRSDVSPPTTRPEKTEPPPEAPLVTTSNGPLDGRAAKLQAKLVEKYGGSPETQAAVARGLKWLAQHQLPDGGWSFNHALAPQCNGKCLNPGSMLKARCGATGMALLPFLAAGQTHKNGHYANVVKNGLSFLMLNMKPTQDGAKFSDVEGSLYAHALATQPLCEAYAMTRDKRLELSAQQAVNYICNAQDPIGGGWRYQPREAGDTSATGWQIAALRAGYMGRLQVPAVVSQKAMRFLDNMQSDSGASYGYNGPMSNNSAMTASGLASRIHLGWKKDNEALQRGVQSLTRWGFSPYNMYYNYYATQVLFQSGGEQWNRWNFAMRDFLLRSQSSQGHEVGSWCFEARETAAQAGGRHYYTTVSLLMLEVYYRYLPIFRETPAGAKPSKRYVDPEIQLQPVGPGPVL